MDARLRTALRAAALSMRICVPTVAEALVGHARRADCDARLAWWSRKLLDDIDVRLDVRGREHLDPSTPTLVMSNHQSLYDIPVLLQVLPGSVRMVSKKEIFWIPVFGQAMRAAEFVEVDRGDRAQAIASLRNARCLIENGITVWIAPEGTRSADGSVGPFKKGGFVLAEEAGVPIQPITIDGTGRILPARTTDLHVGRTVRVTIHPRVRRDEVPDRDAWMARVREVIASGLAS